ncbi:Gastrula zinc finger protein XlCGF64.1 [Amphibalanus amphitrite]|uniref:Gastrula zinc finger protein XlCGF64.1 n=1 Tax=Amphibalanus amphitrite TaxID=1232801 RepID=A0A6A4WZG2_AMPAM|nr:Gastrula zinc finger protein XlCGF64.1 [Amphibalanus amphitrite]
MWRVRPGRQEKRIVHIEQPNGFSPVWVRMCTPRVVETPWPVEPRVVETPWTVEPRVVETPWPVEPRVVETPWTVEPRVVETPWPVEPRVVETPWPVEPRVGGDTVAGGAEGGGDTVDGGAEGGGDNGAGGAEVGGDTVAGGAEGGGDTVAGGAKGGGDTVAGGAEGGGDTVAGGAEGGGDTVAGGAEGGGNTVDGGAKGGGDTVAGGAEDGGDTVAGGAEGGGDTVDGGAEGGGDTVDGGAKDTTMTSSAPLACAVCSVKFEDLDSLLQHMATGHAASSAPPPAAATASGQPASTRQIVLSRTAFLRLKPLLQQGAGRGVVTIVTQRGGGAATVARRPIRPRPPKPASSDGALDVEVLEPSEPPAPSEPAGQQPPIDPDWIECCVCRRRFKHKYSLVAHCRQHIMSRLCGVCHRRLPDGQALVEHLETHMEKNSSFKCDQCDKSFVHAKSLYVHKRNHSGVRPYTCQYCHKTFRHWHKHRVHVRIHTGERPYRCDVCGWGFPRNDECKRHMRTHVGQKAFHCVDCGVGCGTQIALMRHQELHHGKRRPSIEGETQDSAEATEERRGEPEPSGADADKAADSFADLDDNVTVKVEMDNFSLEEHDADASVEANAEGPEHLPEPVIQPVMVIKEEPRDSDEEPTARAASPAAAAPWDADSSSELDEANVSLLEPEVNLTELFIDIERMRSTIRRKIAENAHKFEDAVTQKARSYVRDREPSIANMRSILRAKLEEGKRIQALLSSQETEKRQVKIESVSPRKKIKTEPEDADDSVTLNSDNIAGTSTATDLNSPDSKLALGRSRRLPPSVGLGFRRRGRPPKEFLRGRKSDPSATPRVPRRRWIQHELNFSTEEDGLDETAQLSGVRISTGFGEL